MERARSTLERQRSELERAHEKSVREMQKDRQLQQETLREQMERKRHDHEEESESLRSRLEGLDEHVEELLRQRMEQARGDLESHQEALEHLQEELGQRLEQARGVEEHMGEGWQAQLERELASQLSAVDGAIAQCHPDRDSCKRRRARGEACQRAQAEVQRLGLAERAETEARQAIEQALSGLDFETDALPDPDALRQRIEGQLQDLLRSVPDLQGLPAPETFQDLHFEPGETDFDFDFDRDVDAEDSISGCDDAEPRPLEARELASLAAFTGSMGRALQPLSNLAPAMQPLLGVDAAIEGLEASLAGQATHAHAHVEPVHVSGRAALEPVHAHVEPVHADIHEPGQEHQHEHECGACAGEVAPVPPTPARSARPARAPTPAIPRSSLGFAAPAQGSRNALPAPPTPTVQPPRGPRAGAGFSTAGPSHGGMAAPEPWGGRGELQDDAIDELHSLMLEMRADMHELRDSLEALRRELRSLPDEPVRGRSTR